MAKKAAAGEMTIAEAVRQTWRELGPKAHGLDVAEKVKEKYGHVVPSSTVSIAKHVVFGSKYAMRAKKLAKVTIRKRPDQIVSKAELIRELLASGLDSPIEVAEAARAMGVMVAANQVSMIKNSPNLTGTRPRKPTKRAGLMSKAASVTAGGDSALALENAALKLALKAGSVEAAIKALGRLQ